MSTKAQQQTPVVTAAHAAFFTTEPRPLLLTVEQFPARNPAFTQSGLRNLIFKAEPRQSTNGEIPGNGLIEAGAIIRLGRRVLIDEAKFLAWAAGTGTAPIEVRQRNAATKVDPASKAAERRAHRGRP